MSGELPPIRNNSDRSCCGGSISTSSRITHIKYAYKLSVNVAADGDGAAHGLNVGLLHQDLPRLVQQLARVPLCTDIKPRTLSHNFLTSGSVSCLHCESCSIQVSTSCSIGLFRANGEGDGTVQAQTAPDQEHKRGRSTCGNALISRRDANARGAFLLLHSTMASYDPIYTTDEVYMYLMYVQDTWSNIS